MQVEIADDFLRAGVRVKLGCLSALVSTKPSAPPLLAAMSEEEERRARELAGCPPSEVPAVAETRRAHRALGKAPTRYRASSEALMRRLRQGKGLYDVNSVVDVNNLVSLRTGLPAGSYDRDTLAPPLCLRRGRADESFDAIGRGPLKLEGLPVLVDRHGPFGSPTSDRVRSRIGPQTGSVLVVIYGFGARDGVEDAMTRAARLLETHCNARNLERSSHFGGQT